MSRNNSGLEASTGNSDLLFPTLMGVGIVFPAVVAWIINSAMGR